MRFVHWRPELNLHEHRLATPSCGKVHEMFAQLLLSSDLPALMLALIGILELPLAAFGLIRGIRWLEERKERAKTKALIDQIIELRNQRLAREGPVSWDLHAVVRREGNAMASFVSLALADTGGEKQMSPWTIIARLVNRLSRLDRTLAAEGKEGLNTWNLGTPDVTLEDY
jgi:hypothetical protein